MPKAIFYLHKGDYAPNLHKPHRSPKAVLRRLLAGHQSLQLSYSLKSLKGCYAGDDYGTTVGVINRDTRGLGLDYNSMVYYMEISLWAVGVPS